MKKITIVLLSTVMVSYANNLLFIDKDFDEFLKRIVPSSVRVSFAKKYKEFHEKLVTLSPSDQIEQKYELFQHALHALEGDHKAWADDIQFFLKDLRFLDQAYDEQRAVVREFLERYGFFKQFSHESLVHISVAKQGKARKVWETVKTQIAQATHKMSDWVKGKSHAWV